MRGAILFIPSGVAAAMSYWQLQRMQWKEEIVQEAQQQMALPPTDLFREDSQQFRRVSATGYYQHDRAVFVGPRPLSYEPKDPATRQGMQQMLTQYGAIKSGYLLITPLTSEDRQSTILVNRGWVPPYWRTLWVEVHQAKQPLPVVRVEGTVQGSENPSSFVPSNDPSKGDYYWLDIPGIAEALELPANTPLLQVLVSDDGTKGESPTTTSSVFPLPKPTDRVVKYGTMPLDHANYAFMWGAMSASMAVLAVRMLRKGK